MIADVGMNMDAHLGLVRWVASGLERRGRHVATFDDLVAEGMLGLARAMERYDASRGLAFSTYAVPVVRGAIIDAIEREERYERRTPVSLDAPIDTDNTDDGEPITPGDFVADTSPSWLDELELRDVSRAVVDAIHRLPDREREVVLANVVHGRTLQEIGEAMGRSIPTMSKARTDGLTRLRRWLS